MEGQDLLQGTIAERYRIEREIGFGGMARVYLARDLRHHRPVAIKVLRPELAAALGVERFLSEITVTANFHHPNLLQLFDSGEANGRLFYVMPYVPGESLRTRLDREKQLPVEEAVRIASAVAAGLDYAHRNGVVHRDLKPANMLLHEGQPLVADFGIALAASQVGADRLTQTGLSLGTPSYMSPEQAAGNSEIDGRSDVYSLATVLYEMLTGRPPHTGNNLQAVLAKVMMEEPIGLRSVRADVPEHLEAAVTRALKKSPEDRFASAKDFAGALNARAIRVTDDGTDDGKLPDDASRKSGLRALVGARGPLIGGAIAVVAALAAGGWAVSHRANPSRMVRFQLELAPNERVADPGGIIIAASPEGDRFAYLASRAGGPRKLYLRGASFDISPDGKTFLLPRSQNADARMIVVYDWRDELKALVRSAQR